MAEPLSAGLMMIVESLLSVLSSRISCSVRFGVSLYSRSLSVHFWSVSIKCIKSRGSFSGSGSHVDGVLKGSFWPRGVGPK